MKKSSSIIFINVGALATIVSLAIITPHAVAQTSTPCTGSQDTGTANAYERNNDNAGLWGLAGLAGLFGLLGRRQEKDRSTMGRNDTPVYRDPNIR